MLELFSIGIDIGRFRKCWLSKSMCNPKDNLVRMIRTMFGIGTIRKYVEVEVKPKTPTSMIDQNDFGQTIDKVQEWVSTYELHC